MWSHACPIQPKDGSGWPLAPRRLAPLPPSIPPKPGPRPLLPGYRCQTSKTANSFFGFSALSKKHPGANGNCRQTFIVSEREAITADTVAPSSCAIRCLVTTFSHREATRHDDHALPAPAAPAPHRTAQRAEAEGHLLPPARTRRHAGSRLPLRRQAGHQSRLQQLPWFDGPPQPAGSRHPGHSTITASAPEPSAPSPEP